MASVETANDRFGLRQMLREFRGAALLTDGELRICEVTDEAASLLERSIADLRGRSLEEALPQLLVDRWAEREDAEPLTLEWEGSPSGPPRRLRFDIQLWRDEPGDVAFRLFLVHPADDLAALQARLGQQSRLSTLGTLVSGIAHEINNPLTGVLGFLELILLQTEDEQVAEDLRRAYDAAQRCRRIVSGLLTFARGGREEKVSFDLNAVVAKTLDIVGGSLRRAGIEVTQNLQPDLPTLTGDFFQIQQVLLNLITNAQHALAERWRDSGGHLEITTETTGDGLRLRVRDDGTGISDENLAKIFDPFFTTKAVGEGTGLGLAVSYGIAKEHGGTLRLESEVGQGTEAVLELPVPGWEPVEPERSPHRETRPRPESGSQPLRLLLVDDEEVIRLLMEQILRRDGHEVIAVGDGMEAWRRLESGERFDGILSDLRMPKMGGAELHERLKEHDPALAARMIFITGDVADEESAGFYERVKDRTLLKPCTMESVLSMVGRVLGRPSDAGRPRSTGSETASVSSGKDRNKTL